jgi:hypothetical protein
MSRHIFQEMPVTGKILDIKHRIGDQFWEALDYAAADDVWGAKPIMIFYRLNVPWDMYNRFDFLSR